MKAPMILSRSFMALALSALASVAASSLALAASDLPAPIPVSLSTAGELGHFVFQVEKKHRFFFALRLHFDPADKPARERLRQLWNGTRPTASGPTDLQIHLTLRRIDSAGGALIFDDVVEALPQGFGGDWFERTISTGFLLEPGRYESVITLLQPRQAFAPFPATLALTSDKGRVNYDH
jgi:Domain of unknown function (DUF5625)